MILVDTKLSENELSVALFSVLVFEKMACFFHVGNENVFISMALIFRAKSYNLQCIIKRKSIAHVTQSFVIVCKWDVKKFDQTLFWFMR